MVAVSIKALDRIAERGREAEKEKEIQRFC